MDPPGSAPAPPSLLPVMRLPSASSEGMVSISLDSSSQSPGTFSTAGTSSFDFVKLSSGKFPLSKSDLARLGLPVGFEIDVPRAAAAACPQAHHVSQAVAETLRCPNCKAYAHGPARDARGRCGWCGSLLAGDALAAEDLGAPLLQFGEEPATSVSERTVVLVVDAHVRGAEAHSLAEALGQAVRAAGASQLALLSCGTVVRAVRLAGRPGLVRADALPPSGALAAAPAMYRCSAAAAAGPLLAAIAALSQTPVRGRFRALQPALAAALALLPPGRPFAPHVVLLLLAGAPSPPVSPHDQEAAAAHWTQLATQLRAAGARLELLCCGPRAMNIRSLLPAVAASCGRVGLLRDLLATGPLAQTLAGALAPLPALDGPLLVRLVGLRLTQVLGAGGPASRGDGGAVQLLPGPAALTALLEPHEADGRTAALLQLELRGCGPTRTTRLLTLRLPLGTAVRDLAPALDPELSGLLLVKQTVAAARVAPALTPVLDRLDQQVVHALKALPTAAGVRVARLAYLARRGPLLGPQLQHEDDVAAHRAAFLQAPSGAALRLLEPALLVAGRDEPLHAEPLEDVALRPNAVALLDTGHELLVWHGRASTGPEWAAARELVRGEAAARQAAGTWWPAPAVLETTDGTGAARLVLARVPPAHRDGLDAHLSAFPRLAQLSAAERVAFLANFPYTDDPSFLQYLQPLQRRAKSSS